MIDRRKAREWALQMIFELDQNPGQAGSPEAFFDEFWNGQLRLRDEKDVACPPGEDVRAFAERLVRGVVAHRDEIDAKIRARLRNWSLERVGSLERAVLRLGVYEIVFSGENGAAPPSPVVINEAVDLAKYFSTNESGRFVNGILDAVARRQRDAHSRDPRGRAAAAASAPPADGEVWTPGT